MILFILWVINYTKTFKGEDKETKKPLMTKLEKKKLIN